MVVATARRRQHSRRPVPRSGRASTRYRSSFFARCSGRPSSIASSSSDLPAPCELFSTRSTTIATEAASSYSSSSCRTLSPFSDVVPDADQCDRPRKDATCFRLRNCLPKTFPPRYYYQQQQQYDHQHSPSRSPQLLLSIMPNGFFLGSQSRRLW